MGYVDSRLADRAEEVHNKEKSHRLTEYMPDGRHRIEQDLFGRVAPIWLIDRQTKIRMHLETEFGYRGT